MSCPHAYPPGEWCPACGDVPDAKEELDLDLPPWWFGEYQEGDIDDGSEDPA